MLQSPLKRNDLNLLIQAIDYVENQSKADSCGESLIKTKISKKAICLFNIL